MLRQQRGLLDSTLLAAVGQSPVLAENRRHILARFIRKLLDIPLNVWAEILNRKDEQLAAAQPQDFREFAVDLIGYCPWRRCRRGDGGCLGVMVKRVKHCTN